MEAEEEDVEDNEPQPASRALGALEMYLLTHYSLLSTLDSQLQLQARNVAPSPLTDNALATQPTKWMKYCCLIKIVWNKSDDFHFRFRFGFRFRFLSFPLLSSPFLSLPKSEEGKRICAPVVSPGLASTFGDSCFMCMRQCAWESVRVYGWVSDVCVCVCVLCLPVAPYKAELPKIGQDSFTCLESFLFATLLALLGKTSEIASWNCYRKFSEYP